MSGAGGDGARASDAHVLLVTSAGASPAAVVPVLAALEAAGMRVRAIDVGGAGGGGGGVADRVRRALLGEGAERRLRKELEVSPPDAAVVFDPDAALALTVARDQVPSPAPVVAIVSELEPAAAWAQTDADRFLAIDDVAAVALTDAGVEGDRILVVGALGERGFADAGQAERAALRARFKLQGRVALVEVAGLGAEATSGLALQLSLLDGNDAITFLFDAGGDADAAAVLRRQVPALGLRGKLFGATGDAPLLWRAADVVVARPRPEVVARTLLLGATLVALVDDQVTGAAAAAAALELRQRARPARGLLLLPSALDGAFAAASGPAAPRPTADGADNVADIVAAVAGDKRAVIDERRAAAHAQTRDKVRAASAAATASARNQAAAGDLEDLGGGDAEAPDVAPPAAEELARLRLEVRKRIDELTRAMMAARTAADELSGQARAATGRGEADPAAALERRAEAERARMHALLGELAILEKEAAELERAAAAAPRATRPSSSAPPPRSGPAPRPLDDELDALKRRAQGPGAPTGPTGPTAPPRAGKPAPGVTLDDELAELKRKMAAAPPRKKP